jgi:hypothetical protein
MLGKFPKFLKRLPRCPPAGDNSTTVQTVRCTLHGTAPASATASTAPDPATSNQNVQQSKAFTSLAVQINPPRPADELADVDSADINTDILNTLYQEQAAAGWNWIAVRVQRIK